MQLCAQLGLSDKGCAIKEFVVCWVLPYLIWAIELFTLQFTRSVSSRLGGEDLKPHEVISQTIWGRVQPPLQEKVIPR